MKYKFYASVLSHDNEEKSLSSFSVFPEIWQKNNEKQTLQDWLGTEVWRDGIYKVISADRAEQNSNRYIENI